MDTDVVKQQVWALADVLNTVLGERLIEPDQQRVKKENISLKGRKGERLYIKPATDGYLVGLSGDASCGVRVAAASLNVVAQAGQVLVPARAAHLVALELRVQAFVLESHVASA